jgi:HAD superfamily hydrolase (TIGR01509 family)
MAEGNPAGRRVEAVVFDFDGTLVDATEAILHCLAESSRVFHVAELPRDDVLRMIGRPLREIFAAASPASSAGDIEACVAEYRRIFDRVCGTMSRPMPGAAEMLSLLSPRMRLGIATSRTSGGAARILTGLGLLKHFSAIVGIEEVAVYKPLPEPVIKTLELLGVAPASAAMVGDTPDDVLAGKAAGLLTVGVTTGAHGEKSLQEAGADHVIGGLGQLPPIVGVPGA